jgi:hypothetical protein
MKYETAEQWREEAMQRPDGVEAEESESRRQMVQAHHVAEGTEPDAETLADYELYILGKMGLEEYQDYLFFKHQQGSEG